MPKHSAGLLLYRRSAGGTEVFLVHPGGPYWARRDAGAWTIPKGEPDPGEDPASAALREFTEETGFAVDGPLVPLTPVRQAGGKTVTAFAVSGDVDPGALRCASTVSIEWPPRSGRRQEFPEVDRGAWFDLATAREKLNRGQVPLLEELTARL